MRNTLLTAVAVATLAIATPALAQDNAGFTGVRAEVAAGLTDVDSFNPNDVVYSAALGVDAPLGTNWTVGTEVSVANVFENHREYGVAARLGYALNSDTLVFGRAGYTNFEDTRNFSREGLALGAGVERRLGENTYLSAQYRYTDFDRGDGAHGALIGFGYRF